MGPGAPVALEILVVDGNRDAADTLAILVKSAGHHLRVAYDGQAAMVTALAQKLDVIVLDVGLPKINGYDVACLLRTQLETRDVILSRQCLDRRMSDQAFLTSEVAA